MKIDRRAFLRASRGAFGGFIALSAAGCRAGQITQPRTGDDYGPLIAAGPDLEVPEGFVCRAFGLEGETMSDGARTPPAHDGMGAFRLPNRNIRLIRNHEVSKLGPPDDPAPDPGLVYDAMASAGTTSLEIDPSTRRPLRDFWSLRGTLRNCAGGVTPWGSWLTCEESFAGPKDGFQQRHGYVFEVPASSEVTVPPEPLRAMGRFVHEAVAVDPTSGIIYETEDRGRAGFYRFLPDRPFRPRSVPDLAAGGRLEMLAVRGRPNLDTATGQTVGAELDVHWVPIDDPDPPDGAPDSAVFSQGFALGAARFRRLEGCWYADGSVFFDCTTGGEARSGQIWEYVPDGPAGGTLRLLFQSPGPEILDRPDNLCVSPRGGLVLCEDGVEDALYLRGLTPEGHIFDLARNIRNSSELAGSTFSPDGQTLFMNIQRGPGSTFAIWGPWDRGPL